MKIPICQRVFQYFCHFFIFSGTYPKQRGANAVFCAFWHDKGWIFIPSEYRLPTPALKIECAVSPTTTNQASSTAKRKKTRSLSRQRRHWIHARHALSAGVQTMRARICSAFSCDMFARVVWLKPRRAAKPPTFTLFFAARTCHARLARLTRARGNEPMHAVRWLASPRQGRRFLRGWKILLNDFWYFSSQKSTIKKEVTL